MAFIPWLKAMLTKFLPTARSAAASIAIPAPATAASRIEDELQFMSGGHLTLGIEFEVGVMNAASRRIQPIAREMVGALGGGNFHGEAANHVLEITTGVCERLQQAEADLQAGLQKVWDEAARRDVVLTGTGCVLLYNQKEFTTDASNQRYMFLRERRQILFDRFNSMQGMHMHFGMRSADECIRYHNFFIHFLPHLLSLSASTPFENGVDTGLATCRPIVSEAMPFAGLPYPFINWEDYKSLCRSMAGADAIRNVRDLWWDLRPSPRLGTLEIRVCDQPATLAEGLAIVAFMHVLAHWFEEHHGWLDEMPRPSAWRLRENKWRAMRDGLDAELVINNQGETRSVKTDILLWLERAAPYIARYKYEPYIDTLRQMLARGNSSQRQRRLFNATQSLAAVADFNVRELQAGVPQWDELDKIVANAAPADGGIVAGPIAQPVVVPFVSGF